MHWLLLQEDWLLLVHLLLLEVDLLLLDWLLVNVDILFNVLMHNIALAKAHASDEMRLIMLTISQVV